MTELLSRIQGCLLGVAIGDGLGQPVEIMTPEEIKEALGPEGVTGFIDSVQKKIKENRDLKAGDTTDDWELTGAIARALIKKGKFDLISILDEHLLSIKIPDMGWGPTTRNALLDIQKFIDTDGKEGRDPTLRLPATKPGRGCGNGIGMKAAPLGIYYAFNDDRVNFKDAVIQVGDLTHPDVRASILGYAVAYIIKQLLTENATPGKSMLSDLIVEIALLEDVLHARIDGERPSQVLNRIYHLDLLDDPDKLLKEIGTDCFSMQSVPFSIATFLRHPTDFRTGVLEAVNAGGDADTTGSMVGAMIGANVGLEGIPQEWRDFSPAFQVPIELGKQLYEVVTKNK